VLKLADALDMHQPRDVLRRFTAQLEHKPKGDRI
jgi:hypothetical protein